MTSNRLVLWMHAASILSKWMTQTVFILSCPFFVLVYLTRWCRNMHPKLATPSIQRIRVVDHSFFISHSFFLVVFTVALSTHKSDCMIKCISNWRIQCAHEGDIIPLKHSVHPLEILQIRVARRLSSKIIISANQIALNQNDISFRLACILGTVYISMVIYIKCVWASVSRTKSIYYYEPVQYNTKSHTHLMLSFRSDQITIWIKIQSFVSYYAFH